MADAVLYVRSVSGTWHVLVGIGHDEPYATTACHRMVKIGKVGPKATGVKICCECGWWRFRG